MSGLGSGDGYNSGDGVGEETRHCHWRTCSLTPGTGLLGGPAQLAREGKEMAIIKQTQWPEVRLIFGRSSSLCCVSLAIQIGVGPS